jgi:hypothetical protein
MTRSQRNHLFKSICLELLEQRGGGIVADVYDAALARLNLIERLPDDSQRVLAKLISLEPVRRPGRWEREVLEIMNESGFA